MSIDVGDEQVALERIEAIERLSRPFTIVADIVAPLELDLQPHLGKPAALSLLEDEQVLRYFHGLMIAGDYLKETPTGHHYRLTIEPWSYFLAQNRAMTIFQDLNAVEIIKQVLDGAGVSDVDYSKLSKPRVRRIYTAQYRESHFAFISRLMEEEGIYYFFRHEAAKHVMVLCESPAAHVEGIPATLQYKPTSVSVFATDSTTRFGDQKYALQTWTERVSTGGEVKVTTHDFDFESPERPLTAEHAAPGAHSRDAAEVFMYPGRYRQEKTGRGEQEKTGAERGQTLLEGLRANRRQLAGTSQAGGLSCGYLMTVEQHPATRMNGRFLLTSTFHSIAAETYRSGQRADEMVYNVRVEAIPADTPFRASHSTPKPVAHADSGTVSGPAGEKIYTDEFGRVKARLNWDRSGTSGEKASCWMRVDQNGGLGNIDIPRVGEEVRIGYEHDDPDKPYIKGRLFNKANMPIYDLPANKTRTVIRSKTYGQAGPYPDARPLDTGAPDANEIRLEDSGGKEEFFVHANRDMNTRVRFKETHHVGNDQQHIVGHDRSAEVGRNEKKTVGQQRDVTIGQTDHLRVGKTLLIEAGTSITLRVGQSSIVIDAMGIHLHASNISADAKLAVEVHGPNATVTGHLLTLNGNLTKIN